MYLISQQNLITKANFSASTCLSTDFLQNNCNVNKEIFTKPAVWRNVMKYLFFLNFEINYKD